MHRGEVNLFTKLITLFVTTILILTRRSNILTMFVGWEGVGVISFILIGWFIRRENAISSAFSAFIFNRVSDFFFLVLLLWEIRESSNLFYRQLSKEITLQNNV